jgi:Spy/CpxP family protein refolding chaperone
MRSKKRYLGYGLALLAAVLLMAGGAALARDHGPWRGGGPEGFLSHMDQEVKQLNLNATQQKLYLDFRSKLAADMQAAQARHQTFAAAVKAELQQDQPNWKAIADLMKADREAMSQGTDDKLNAFVAFYNALDAQQQKAVRDHILAKLDHFPGHRD